VSVFESHALGSQVIQVCGNVGDGCAKRAYRVPVHVVSSDDEEVQEVPFVGRKKMSHSIRSGLCPEPTRDDRGQDVKKEDVEKEDLVEGLTTMAK